MRTHRSLAAGLSCLVAALVLAVPTSASADDGGSAFPLVKAQRPLALTPGKLRVDLPFNIRNIPAQLPTGEDEVGVFFGGGVEYGILKGLTVGGQVLNVRLTPDADYLNPSIFALYQFVFGNFEMGARVRATLPIEDDSNTVIEIGVPFGFALGNAGYLQISPDFGLVLPKDGEDLQTTFTLAAELTANLTREIFLHARVGFQHARLSAKDAWGIPLGVGAGYTLGEGDDPMMDIFLNFDFDPLYTKVLDEANADFWSITIGVNWFVL